MALKITVRENDKLDVVLKRFKRLCDKEGLNKCIKQKSYYEKPSDKRRRKEKERLRSLRKDKRKREKLKLHALRRARRRV